MQVRRVVTGITPEGKSVFASDERVDAITLAMLPGYEFHRVWGTDEAPTLPVTGHEPMPAPYFPPTQGFRFGLFTVGVDAVVRPGDIDMAAALGELEEKLPGMA